MARSSLSLLSGCAFALAAALAAGAQSSRSDELQFTSGPLVLDRQTNMMRAQGPRITQGDLSLVADDALATGFEFDKAGEFRLTGNVRIEVGSAVMEAASAVFSFADGRLSRGELEGTPVAFRDFDEQEQTSITGRADRMSYDYVARTLRMTGDASVRLDNREIMGCDLIYDFAAERVTSGSASCAYRVRILPESDEQASAAPPQ
jgi:lipopolysaccharide transport protein LptA